MTVLSSFLVVGIGIAVPLATGQFGSCSKHLRHLAGGERIGWDSVGGPPVPATIGDSEAVIGRIRVYSQSGELYIAAYRSRGVKRLWRIGPLGTYSEAYRNILFGVHAGRVVVTDARANVYLHDLQTGERIQQIALTDRAELICVPSHRSSKDEQPPHVWLKIADKRHHLLDVTTGETEEARKRPAWCKQGRHTWKMKPSGKTVSLKVDGFRALRSHVEADTGVAGGVKHPGTAIPRAVGFDPETRKVSWQQALPTVDMASVRPGSSEWDGLAGGRYIATYGSGQDTWHLTALDARTGDRLWDTRLRPLFAVDKLDGMIVTEEFVYLLRTSSLEVFDSKTGKLLGTIGDETYD